MKIKKNKCTVPSLRTCPHRSRNYWDVFLRAAFGSVHTFRNLPSRFHLIAEKNVCGCNHVKRGNASIALEMTAILFD